MNDCMANVSLFIIRTAYGPEAEKINLLAGLPELLFISLSDFIWLRTVDIR